MVDVDGIVLNIVLLQFTHIFLAQRQCILVTDGVKEDMYVTPISVTEKHFH